MRQSTWLLWTSLFVPLGLSTAPAADEHTVHRFERIELSSEFFSEGATHGDFDGDGDQDVVSGPYWYEGPKFDQRHEIYPPKPFDPKVYSDNFFAWTRDYDRDGRLDILFVGFPGKDASWFRNPGPEGGHWERHVVFDVVDNESPWYTDLTGDGEPELVCQTDGRFGYAGPDPKDPAKPWRFVPISEKLPIGRFTHGLGVGDVNGDGRADVLWKAGWFEQPASLDGAPLWKHHPFEFAGPGGSQMHVRDLDGDGDGDVITALHAHGHGLVWYEQQRSGDEITFVEHAIMGSKKDPRAKSRYGVSFAVLHAIDLADIDGDGDEDIITGTRWWAHGGRDEGDRDSGIYWFEVKRSDDGKLDFIPHLMDDQSGVGTQVVAGDLDGDGDHDIVIGNKKGTFVLVHQREKVDAATWRKSLPRIVAAAGLSPQDAVEAMTVPEGFDVRLAAGEPDVHQPVALTIDERGRVWIVEAFTYPRRAPEGQGKDRVLILEDTDGDGTLDHRKVFAEGLNLVSGIEVGFGGVWIGAAPYLLFIPDRDGDDRPDGEPQVLLDGWGYGDTHETLNAFIWGPDGWLYGCQGVFTHSRVGKPGTPDEERVPLNCCVWRYHPTRHDFEVFAWGTSNPWGVDFDDHGQAFITACVIPHLYHVIQGGRYQRQAGQHFNPHVYDDLKAIGDHLHHGGKLWTPDHNALADEAGGGHAHCGAMVYLGDSFPAEYRNRIFMNNIHGNRVNVDILRPEGSGYVGSHGKDFLRANDLWFRGINLRYGPDGSVYLIDWYDQQACHRNEPEIWDRGNGRVYRISWKGPRKLDVDLARASTEELVRLHLHPNDWHVRTARRILQERGSDPAAHALLLRLLEATDDPTRKLRAMWTLAATGGFSEELARELLRDPSAHVRAWTVQLALDGQEPTDRLLARLGELSREDPSPVVRLYLASALQQLPTAKRWDIAAGLVAHAEDASDHNLPLLIWYGIEPLAAEAPERAMALALDARIPLLTRFTARRVASDIERLDPILAAVERAPSDQVRKVFLEEMVQAFRGHAKVPMPKRWSALYEKLASTKDAEIASRLEALAVKFGDRRIFPRLRAIAADDRQPTPARRNALDVLLGGRDPDLVPTLVTLLDTSTLRREAIRGLAGYEDPRIPTALLERYESWTAEERADALQTLAARPAFATELLDALASGAVPRKDVTAFTIRQLSSFGDEKLDERIAAVWGSVRATSEDKLAEIARLQKMLTPDDLALADLPNGRLVFERTCATCHQLFGSGDDIGPDLTGSNRVNVAYVLENAVDPNAVVGKDYLLNVFVTKTGRVVSGLVRKRTSTAVTVRTVNEEVVVPVADILVERLENASMMPEGLLAQLGKKDVRDLVAYLGSPVQVPVPGAPVTIDPESRRAQGVLEGEKLAVEAGAPGSATPQNMAGFGAGKWSGDSQLWWTGAKPGAKLTLRFPVAEAGRYQVDIALTKAVDYAVVQLAIDGEPVETPIDCFHRAVVPTGPIRLGERDLTAGDHRLTVEIVGAHPQAVKAFMFGLDYIHLVPIR